MAAHKITFILGNAQSGKFRFVDKYYTHSDNSLLYLTTRNSNIFCPAQSAELVGKGLDQKWHVVEEPLDIAEAIRERSHPETLLVIDCITMWLWNVLNEGRDVMRSLVSLISSLENSNGPVIILDAESGVDLASPSCSLQSFQAEAERVKKAVASVSTEVLYIISGLPMCLKKDGKMNHDVSVKHDNL